MMCAGCFRSTSAGLVCLLCAALLLPSGCAVGPDYQRPTTPTPTAYKEAAPASEAAQTVDWRLAAPGRPDSGPWWQSFADPELSALMEELGRANQNVQVSLANLRTARAQVREARAAFFPVLSLSGSFSRGRDGGSGILGAEPLGNTYSAGMQASWEPDIWGGTRRSVEGATAQAEAQAADLGAVLLSMRAELALNYFQVRGLDAVIELYGRTVTAYERSLRITENQYRAGTVTRADVAQAREQLKAAEAQLVDARMQRAQTEHAVAVLVGRPPADFHLEPRGITAKLPSIDTGLPAGLLERRPDVAEAERQVMAANAAIGVAESAYFPAFSFGIGGGYESSSFRRWFSVPNEIWSLGPSVAMTLFQGGALIARTEQARSTWEAYVASYRQTVLQAFSDVEDALVSVRLLEEQEARQAEALAAARDAETMLLNQYRAGTVTYVSVVTAQATALTDAVAVEQLRASRYAAAVSLIRALGGGWDTSGFAADGSGLPEK